MTEHVTVTATRWDLGWELELDRGGVTQTRTLGKAVQQVRDYLDTIDEATSHDDWDIDIVPMIGPVLDDAREARSAAAAAAAATAVAARKMRHAVRGLRDAGLSVTDTAAVLGVSRGRVSQLTTV